MRMLAHACTDAQLIICSVYLLCWMVVLNQTYSTFGHNM